MQQLANTAFLLGLIGYSMAFALFVIDLARREPTPLAVRWAPRLVGAAAALHFAHVVISSFLTHTCPVGSVHFALSLVGLLSVVIYLILRRRENLHAIGALVTPTALTFLVAAQFVGATRVAAAPRRALLNFHITANLAGVTLFLLAATAGVLYLIKERQLRQKRLASGPAKLPPLDVLDTTLNRLLLLGFPLLTLGVVSGAVFAKQVEYGNAADLARAALAYATWLVVAGVLVLRKVAGWRGRRSAYGAILGTAFVLVVLVLYVVLPGARGGS